MAHASVEYPQAQEDANTYSFSPEELAQIEAHAAKYPERRSAVMPALWLAQEKFGWLPQKAIQLVADTLGLSFAHVYGVATFYTMYLKEKPGANLLEVCTCFGCYVSGGQEMYEHLKNLLQIGPNGASPDGQFWLREAECLGACDAAPCIQVNNRRLAMRVKYEDVPAMLETLKQGGELPYVPMPLEDQRNLA